MKAKLIALAFAGIISTQAANAGVIHKMAQVASAPLWIVGWCAPCVGGFVCIPIHRGFRYFCSRPFVKL